MFERKNQSILSAHYTKLVDHESDGPAADDDFITLKRADHDLNDADLPEHDFKSKRKQKMALSKKAIAKGGPKGTKLVFDEEGRPHEMYEMKSTEEVFKDKSDVKEAGRQFAEAERGRLKEADVIDRAVAKEKKNEKKRKRKDREREVWCSVIRWYPDSLSFLQERGIETVIPVLDAADDDDGYVSPEFDLPSQSDDERGPFVKRVRGQEERRTTVGLSSTLADDEQLALRLLRGKR